MRTSTLLKHFDQISEAPDAIRRLRQLIFELAVRGRLVEHNSEEEPASILLKNIESEWVRLAEAGVVRKPRKLSPDSQYENAFRIPDSWMWVPIRGATADRGQKKPDVEFTYIDVSSINSEFGTVENPKILSPEGAPSRARKIAREGDVIYSCVRPYLLNTAIIDREYEPELIVSTAFAVLHGFNLLSSDYLWIALRSPYFIGMVEEKMRGQAYPAINDRDLAQLPIPLPPRAEQYRIVARVDELMAVCDEHEAAQQTREERRDELVDAILYAMNNGMSDTSFEFKESVRIYSNYLPRLTTRPSHIEELRKTILNLAVRGRLVEQDPEDGPVSKALETNMKSSKSRSSNGGSTYTPDSTKNELLREPFEIPLTWEWVTLGQVANSRLGKMLDQAKNKGTPLPYLRNINVRWFGFDLSDLNLMRFEETELEKYHLRRGDVLICEGGEPGRSAVWDEEGSGIYFQKAVHRVRPINCVDPYYLVYVIFLDASTSRLAEFFTGVTIKHLTGKGLAKYTFPLPPLAEQRRIVARVDELMSLCDELEASLTESSKTKDKLLEVALNEALEFI